jgi:hypothetical protein
VNKPWAMQSWHMRVPAVSGSAEVVMSVYFTMASRLINQAIITFHDAILVKD